MPRIRIHERSGHRLKTASSQRDVPIPAPLALLLSDHAKRVPSNAAALVFPEPFGNYWRALHCFQRSIRQAGAAAGEDS